MNINAKWISHPTAKDEASYFRKTFNIENTSHTTIVNICGLGMYELYINGKKADDRMFTPPFTTYHNQVMYDTYDISHLIKKGKNTIGIIVGNGFYHFNNSDAFGFEHAEWKENSRVICEVINGENTVAVSDTSFFTSTGAIVYNAIYVGEVYDARLEKNWADTDFDDSDWVSPIVSRPPGGSLEPSDNLPIRITDIIEPTCKWELPDGSYIYDFGKNMSGFILLSGKGKSGSKVKFTYSERYDEKVKDIDNSKVSMYVYNDNFQTDYYIFGNEAVKDWHPRFNWHGFRYVKVINEGNADITLKACFLRADIKPAGKFKCSNELINKIQDAVVQSTISNFQYFPTDCPHREKLGWTGDAQLSAEQTLYNLQAKDFYIQWLKMFPYAQSISGHIPATIPRPGCCSFDVFEGPVWDSVLFVIPWNIYLYTGDKSAIEIMYETCKKNLEYSYSCSDNYIINVGLGDWPVYGERFTDKAISVTGYFYHSADCMCRFAEILQKSEDVKKYSLLKENIKKSYINKFIKDGFMKDDTQGGYAMTLSFGLYKPEDEEKLKENLIRTILRTDFHIEGGILTVKHIFCVLSDMGRHDLAMKLILKEDMPSLGYMILNGATTLWESWEGENSQNHHMFGSVSEWFYKHILGIKPLTPGFEEFLIQPSFDMIDFAEGEHKTPYGTIRIRWKKENGKVVYKLSVPENTMAIIVSPNNYSCKDRMLFSGDYTLVFTKINNI